MATEVSPNEQGITQDQRNMGLVIWIASIFFWIIPSLIIFLVKKDDAYISDQAKEALNWEITMVLAWVVVTILCFLLIGIILIPVLYLLNLVIGVMGAIAVSNGKTYRAPFALRLVK